MTDIIKLIEEVGATVHTNQSASPPVYSFAFTPEQIERFAELVAAQEREACAKEAELMVMYPGGRQEAPAHDSVWHAARAIRARSKK